MKNVFGEAPKTAREARALPRKGELPLRELEAFPRPRLAGFLALLHPRVAAKKTFRFQSSAQISIHQQKRTSDRKTSRARLTRGAAAGRVNGKIVGVRELHHLQRLEHRVLK